MRALVSPIETFLCPPDSSEQQVRGGLPLPGYEIRILPPAPRAPGAPQFLFTVSPGSQGELWVVGTGLGHLSPAYQGSPIPRLNIPGCERTVWGLRPPRSCTPGSVPYAGGHRPFPGEWSTWGTGGPWGDIEKVWVSRGLGNPKQQKEVGDFGEGVTEGLWGVTESLAGSWEQLTL